MARTLRCADIYRQAIFKFYAKDDAIAQVNERDVTFMYEAPGTAAFRFCLLAPSSAGGAYGNGGTLGSRKQGQPLCVGYYAGVTTNSQVHRAIARRLQRVLRAEHRFDPASLASNEESGGKGPPYDIVITEGSDDTVIGPLEDDDAVFHLREGQGLAVSFDGATGRFVDGMELAAVDEHASLERRRGSSEDEVDLADCFERFTEREQLGEQDMWYCGKCKMHNRAYKKIDIWSTPDVLILHLKRFQYGMGHYSVQRRKLNALVKFPIESLDLSKVLLGPAPPGAPPVYDLYAVSEHSGSLGGGHYTAVCKNPRTNEWYSFNDSYVQPSSGEGAVTPRAYVLFYKRRRRVRWGGMPKVAPPKEGPGREDEDGGDRPAPDVGAS